MGLFGVRYWKCLFWINIVLAIVHACNGNSLTYVALGMSLLSKLMILFLENSTEN